MPRQSVYLPWAGVSFGRVIQGESKVEDHDLVVNVSTNPGGNNPFFVEHRYLSGSFMESQKPENPYQYVALPGPSSFLGSGIQWAPMPDWNVPNLWARSNPSRPALQLPVSILELREVPGMIRQLGRLLLYARKPTAYLRRHLSTKDLASMNLAVQFGWTPLIKDLTKIVNVQSLVDKRRKEIMNATKGKGYRRRFKLGSTSLSSSGKDYANFGSFQSFNPEWTCTSQATSWAVMKWRPTRPDVGLPSSDEFLRPYVLGLHPSNIVTNVWEALPWSWLVDYFTTIGDIIDAGNHHIATPVEGCVMTTTTASKVHKVAQSSSVRLTEGTLRGVRKQRTPVSPIGVSNVGSVPTLEPKQLSILGSLAVLKFSKALGS